MIKKTHREKPGTINPGSSTGDLEVGKVDRNKDMEQSSLVSWFNGISILVGYLMLKPSL